MHRFTSILVLAAGAVLAANPCSAATPEGKGFPSANAAAQALVVAAKSDNVPALIEILGPSARDIVSTGDRVADRKIRHDFATRAAQKIKLTPRPGRQRAMILLAGRDEWPLPIPIVEVNGKWYFDTAQGKDEILTRRIGGNELSAIEVCRGYVEAQNDYAERHRTDNGNSSYAQKTISSPGQHDGLYSPEATDKEENQIGEIIARAFAEGYTNKHEPYHGYYFRVLNGQGPQAPGGEMSYLDNGAMTKGFALIAWPATYGSTGVMTFVVDKSGIVYQKDLGQKTAETAAGYTAYNPDETWTPVVEPSRP